MGVHYYNYADFPPWDMLFGTFRNPAKFMGECGFEAGADRKIGAMLAFADVNAPLYGPGNLGAKPAVGGQSSNGPPRISVPRLRIRAVDRSQPFAVRRIPIRRIIDVLSAEVSHERATRSRHPEWSAHRHRRLRRQPEGHRAERPRRARGQGSGQPRQDRSRRTSASACSATSSTPSPRTCTSRGSRA